MRRKLSAVILGALFLTVLGSPMSMAEIDPFPGVNVGSEIPGTRITSDPGVSQSDWEATATYQAFSCPEGSGRGIGIDIGAKQWFAYCVKQWQPQATIDAWAEYRSALEAAQAAAEAESRAWNAANPGKQKCVQWGPLRDPNGGESSGGVCANPVEPGPGTTVPTEEAPAVSAPAEATQPSSPVATEPAPTPVSNSNLFVEDTQYRGSGHPFTKIYRGQLSTTDCPVGYQGANGLIAAIGIGTFTECWPENAWAAYRIGGEVWETFKSSGGTYDVMAEVRRRSNVDQLKQEAKRVAQVAADQTPGIQRCSRWNGYGESGTECAYAFIAPSGSSTTSSDSNTVSTDTKTVVAEPTSTSTNFESATTVIADNSTNESATVTIVPIDIGETPVETQLVTVSDAAAESDQDQSSPDEGSQMVWIISRPELELRPL